ncbi:ribonuclease H-like domain-containing protein [Tanacetum coccineum]
MAEVLINNLDVGNPLYLQPNDHSIFPILSFKLTGSENYKMWSTTMKIALKGKNNMGFMDGTCVKPVISHVLSEYWERCNVVVLGSLSQELYLGQVYFEIASEVWSELEETMINNLLARDPLPEVKDAFAIVSKKESHRGLAPGIRPSFFNNTYFNLKFKKFLCAKNHAYMYNVTLGWIIDSGANQHMTVSTKDMFNVVGISSLKLNEGHP